MVCIIIAAASGYDLLLKQQAFLRRRCREDEEAASRALQAQLELEELPNGGGWSTNGGVKRRSRPCVLLLWRPPWYNTAIGREQSIQKYTGRRPSRQW